MSTVQAPIGTNGSAVDAIHTVDVQLLERVLQKQGYPAACFVQPPEDYLICAICTDVVRDPLNLVACGHLFCRECMRGHKKPECPSCRAAIAEDASNTLAAMPFVNSLILNRPFRCVFHTAGCEWVGTLGTDARNLQAHLKRCVYNERSPCDACGEDVELAMMDEHKRETCEMRRSTCMQCHDEMPHSDLLAHRTLGEYEGRPCVNSVTCTSPGCGVVVRGDTDQLMEHLRTKCTKRMVICGVCTGIDTHGILLHKLAAHYAEKNVSLETAMSLLTESAAQSTGHLNPEPRVGDRLDLIFERRLRQASVVELRRAPVAEKHNLVYLQLRARWLDNFSLSEWITWDETCITAPLYSYTRGNGQKRIRGMADTTRETLLRGECTIDIIPEQVYGMQPWFVCRTCTPVGDHVGCCVSCATQCHKGHVLESRLHTPGGFFCDCAIGALRPHPDAPAHKCRAKRTATAAKLDDDNNTQAIRHRDDVIPGIDENDAGLVIPLAPGLNAMNVLQAFLHQFAEAHEPAVVGDANR